MISKKYGKNWYLNGNRYIIYHKFSGPAFLIGRHTWRVNIWYHRLYGTARLNFWVNDKDLANFKKPI